MATPADEEERYIKALIDTVRDTTIKVEQVLAQVDRKLEQHYERIARLLEGYRGDNHRAIMGIHIRIVSLEDTIETDRSARIARQQQLDGELKGIHANQRLWIRVVIFVALVAIGIGLGIWLT